MNTKITGSVRLTATVHINREVYIPNHQNPDEEIVLIQKLLDVLKDIPGVAFTDLGLAMVRAALLTGEEV